MSHQGLKDKSLLATAWGGAGAFARIFLQFLVQVIMARLVGPNEYGVFAVGALVVSLSAFIADFGLAYGLINKKEVSDDDIKFVLTWQIILGFAVALIILLMGPYLAKVYGVKSFAMVIMFAVVCFISALMAPASNILVRELNFKIINIAKVLSYFLAYVFIGLPMAYQGMGAWSLIVAWAAQVTINLLILLRNVKHPLGFRIWHKDAASMFNFGGKVFLSNLVNWFTNNVDRLVVGKISPGSMLGLYSGSYGILYTFISTIMAVIHPIIFSSAAKLDEDIGRLRRMYCMAFSAIIIFLLPVFVGVAAVPETFIVSLYGIGWKEAAKFIPPLALFMPIFALFGISTPILWALKMGTLEPIIQLIGLGGFILSVNFLNIDIESIAYVFLLAGVARFLLAFIFIRRVLFLSFSSLSCDLFLGMLISTFIFLACRFIDDFDFGGLKLKLLIEASASASILFLSIYIFRKIINRDLILVADRVLRSSARKINIYRECNI